MVEIGQKTERKRRLLDDAVRGLSCIARGGKQFIGAFALDVLCFERNLLECIPILCVILHMNNERLHNFVGEIYHRENRFCVLAGKLQVLQLRPAD